MEKKMTSNAIDKELENTVFLIAPAQFSVVRIIILFTNSQIQYKILHILSCTCFFFYCFCRISQNSIDCVVLVEVHDLYCI